MKLSYFKGREKVCTISSKYISNASKCAQYLQLGELLKIEFEPFDIDDTSTNHTESNINIEQERK